MPIVKIDIFLKFKANRYSFGTLSIDHELVDSVYDYLMKSEISKLAQIYSSVNIDDLYIVKYFLDSKRDSDLSNEYDYTLKELLNHIEHANKPIIDFRSYDKVLFGYVTVNEDNTKYEHRQDLLLESILSLSHLSYKNWSICIFLNIPNKALLGKLSDLSFASHINTITSDTNKGLAYGRNRIIDYAKSNYYDYVIFLDDDTYMIDKYLVEKMIYCDQQKPTIAFIGPEIVHKQSLIKKDGNKFFMIEASNKKAYDSFKEVDYIEGSCHMIDINKIGKNTLIGEYPEDYNCYWEEALPAFRAWYCANMQNVVVKGTRVVHIRSGGGWLSKSSVYLFVRNCLYYMEDVSKIHPISNAKRPLYLAKFMIDLFKKIPYGSFHYYVMIIKALIDGIFKKRVTR